VRLSSVVHRLGQAEREARRTLGGGPVRLDLSVATDEELERLKQACDRPELAGEALTWGLLAERAPDVLALVEELESRTKGEER
jgi:hypothetical protein